VKQKKERRNQGRSQSPGQGAVQNGPGPTLPCGSAVQAPLLYFKSLAAQVDRFLGSSSRRARVNQVVIVVCIRPRSFVILLSVWQRVIWPGTVPGPQAYCS
jgi:hypothetical protein